MKTVTAAEANRQFSKLLRHAASGETVVVTSHGKPVARLVPVTDNEEAVLRKRAAAREGLFERLRTQPAMNLGKISREELYDEVIFGEKT